MSRAGIARGEGAALLLRVFKPGARPAETHGHLLTPAGDEPESRAAVDQFEEVFPLCRDKAERARFIDLLPTAREPGSRLRVCIAVRAGFYARCGEHAELANALSRAGLLVGQMNADELREAVVRPAQAVGLSGTVADRDGRRGGLNRPGVLPMLSHALLETWRRRKVRGSRSPASPGPPTPTPSRSAGCCSSPAASAT
ncbi:nSTAND1 domain-containing NTPase [Streptomyces bobili]